MAKRLASHIGQCHGPRTCWQALFRHGASAGIGRGTALALAAEGALLSIAGRDEGALLATRDKIVAQGASVLRIITCDLSQLAGIDAAAAAIAQAERPSKC